MYIAESNLSEFVKTRGRGTCAQAKHRSLFVQPLEYAVLRIYTAYSYPLVHMRSEACGSYFVCVCVFVLSVTAFSVDFGHRVSGSTDIIPYFLCLQVADLGKNALFLRYSNIWQPNIC